MAITKIMCMKSAERGNVAAHLKHSIAYICNEAKTENGSLVGGINCLPDFAYEQMIGTKEMFGQTGGRQGYHFIISLKPGEGTKEQMYEITRRFAEEFLGGEYEGVFSVHTDKDHLHGHLVFNSVNMVTGKKYSYKKGDWKNVIQPITNRLCEEYGLSIVAAEYSKDPVNMNRKQWEKEQSWGDFIKGDMQYCRNKAESFEEFVFLMEKLGYEVNVGVHISVKAEGMRRSRRLDTLGEEFTVQNLQTFYEQERTFKYVEPPVYHPGYALHKKPANAFQQRYYGKLYRMCVVQKCRFQYKYTRYQQDLIRMKELQEEYLFLKREGINGWEDVFRVKQSAEKKIEDIDAKKKELYNEHARYKYQYSAMKTSLYADLQEKLITQEQFNRYREIYSNKLSEIAQAIKVQEATVKSVYENGIAAGQWLDEFRENMEIEKLDRMLLISLIDKILMYEDKRVEIVFKYRNEMAKAVDLIKGELDAGTVARNAVAGNEVAPETVGMIEDSAVSDNSTLSLREVS